MKERRPRSPSEGSLDEEVEGLEAAEEARRRALQRALELAESEGMVTEYAKVSTTNLDPRAEP